MGLWLREKKRPKSETSENFEGIKIIEIKSVAELFEHIDIVLAKTIEQISKHEGFLQPKNPTHIIKILKQNQIADYNFELTNLVIRRLLFLHTFARNLRNYIKTNHLNTDSLFLDLESVKTIPEKYTATREILEYMNYYFLSKFLVSKFKSTSETRLDTQSKIIANLKKVNFNLENPFIDTIFNQTFHISERFITEESISGICSFLEKHVNGQMTNWLDKSYSIIDICYSMLPFLGSEISKQKISNSGYNNLVHSSEVPDIYHINRFGDVINSTNNVIRFAIADLLGYAHWTDEGKMGNVHPHIHFISKKATNLHIAIETCYLQINNNQYEL